MLLDAIPFPEQMNHVLFRSLFLTGPTPVALIRDTVYIDGGLLSWIPGFKNETLGTATPDGEFA